MGALCVVFSDVRGRPSRTTLYVSCFHKIIPFTVNHFTSSEYRSEILQSLQWLPSFRLP